MYKVLIAGSINMDIVVTAERHPQVGETVFGSELQYFPGGKGANQAVAASKLGSNTALIGKLGTDSFADVLKSFLGNQGVNLDHVTNTKTANTGTALIVVADSDNTIVVVPGANGLLDSDDIKMVDVKKGDVIVSQFEVPESTITEFFSRGKAKGATTILNPAPAKKFSQELLEAVDILVVNETELAFLSGCEQTAKDENHFPAVLETARELRAHDDQVVVVTLGADGVIAVLGEREIRVPGRSVEAVDTTGAGDCFVGALAARLSTGATLEKALEHANLAASLAVQRMGAGPSMPTKEELDTALAEEVQS